MESEKCPVVIIGAGVIGCAVAQALAARGLAPIVLEQGPRIAEGVTSRNSGVIHAGLYYQPASLKAQSCIRGKSLLYEWCKKHGVPHQRVGKWVVGSQTQEASLLEMHKNASDSGASGLEPITSVKGRFAGVSAELGIYSRETGIVDAFEFSRSLQIDALDKGANFLFEADVQAIEQLPGGGYRLETSRGPIETDAVVNAAGLNSDEIAKLAGISKYRLYPWRGDYFRLKSATKFEALFYPVKAKNDPGLGVHLTISLDGSLRLGPDVELIASKDAFAPPQNMAEKQLAFFNAARKYLTGIDLNDLSYDSCGIRPKLRSGTDKGEKDFILSQDLPGFINLIGIESPGLTAAMDLADRVAKLL